MLMLEQLLRRPLHVVQASEMVLAKGQSPPPELIVDSPRVLLILGGTLRYTVDGQSFDAKAGEMIFVPALVRRRWKSVAGACDFLFFSFDSDPPLHMDATPLLAWVDVTAEAGAIRRIIKATTKLEAEGEMKGVLARLLTHGKPATPHRPVADGSRGVRAAMVWMEAHFTEPNVLSGLHERADLSAWHFRRTFRQLTGKSPTEHLAELRMRAARFHLVERGEPVKAVARKLGYEDPLYFSRAYRKFWGHPPSEMRAG
jgi:AraC-like DNA-binding protein